MEEPSPPFETGVREFLQAMERDQPGNDEIARLWHWRNRPALPAKARINILYRHHLEELLAEMAVLRAANERLSREVESSTAAEHDREDLCTASHRHLSTLLDDQRRIIAEALGWDPGKAWPGTLAAHEALMNLRERAHRDRTIKEKLSHPRVFRPGDPEPDYSVQAVQHSNSQIIVRVSVSNGLSLWQFGIYGARKPWSDVCSREFLGDTYTLTEIEPPEWTWRKR